MIFYEVSEVSEVRDMGSYFKKLKKTVEIDEKYKKKVFEFLNEMKAGQEYVIAELASPATRTKFISCIKEYMLHFPFNAHIRFSSDMKIFKMIPKFTKHEEKNKTELPTNKQYSAWWAKKNR